MTKKNKLEIQNIIEKILQKHCIDPSGEDYFLKIRLPNIDDDLIIEKLGEQILIGNYYINPCGDYISDPVFAFDYNQGYWFPARIELIFGHKFCSFLDGGFRVIYPDIINEFKMLQSIFAKNIRDQKYLEDGIKIYD